MSPYHHIRLLHRLKFDNVLIKSMFRGEITYYSTAFTGHVRFTTSDQARNKVIDDSNIIFKINSAENFERIRHIFKVNDGQPVFYVDVIPSMFDFRCATSTNTYQYSNIRTGSYAAGMNSVFISGEQIVEKCVLYESDHQTYTFFRFPNLQESS